MKRWIFCFAVLQIIGITAACVIITLGNNVHIGMWTLVGTIFVLCLLLAVANYYLLLWRDQLWEVRRQFLSDRAWRKRDGH